MERVFVFNGEGGQFPAGIFTELDAAKLWIKKYALSGILNVYPLNIGIYDWAIEHGFFQVKNVGQSKSSFVGKFTCAAIEHYHFENGEMS